MSRGSSHKNPDDTYEGFIWSISSRGTLYVSTVPGQPAPRGSSLTAPTRLGVVIQVKWTKKWTNTAGSKIPAFYIQVEPSQPATSSSSMSPVYNINKWYVVAEANFDPFEHVPHWQTPPQLLEAYDEYAQRPKGKAVKEGRWFKNYFAADLPSETNTSFTVARGQVRTITPSTRRRLESDSTSTPPSAGFNVFSGAPTSESPAAAGGATAAMMLSQSSPGGAPAPPQGRNGMCFMTEVSELNARSERRTPPSPAYLFMLEHKNTTNTKIFPNYSL